MGWTERRVASLPFRSKGARPWAPHVPDSRYRMAFDAVRILRLLRAATQAS